jgi:hypothetical protein
MFESELKQINVGKLDTSGLKAAQGQAKLFAAEMERAVKAGDLGQLDTSGIQRAVSEAQALRAAFEQARSAASNIKVPSSALAGGAGGGLSTLGGAFAGGFVATTAIAGVRELGQALNETARRGAVFQQLGDVLDSYTASVGTNSAAMIDAAKKAAQGTISEYELILNANRALQFEVAKTPEQFAKLIELSTALGRAQGISDTSALEFLTTGLARESRLILDNLGLIINVEAATAKYAATIGKTADELSAAERKQALLDEAFRQGATALEANRSAYDSAATQFERFDANVQNLKDSFGRLIAIMSAGGIEAMANAVAALNQELTNKGTAGGAATDLQRLLALREQLQQGQAVAIPGFGQINVNAQSLAAVEQAIADTEAKLNQLSAAERVAGTSMQQAAALSYQAADAHGEYQRQLENTRLKEQALSQERLSGQMATIDKALLSRAEKSVDTIGADQALAQYRQAKADAEAALQSLMDAGVTDATELQFRSAEILTSLLVPFDELEARANQIDFSAMSGAISSLNAGFVDFLPGVSSAREELASLSQEMMYSSTVTAEQLAQFEYLSAVAYSVADGGGQLGAVINDLGSDFLASNAYAAELVNQLVLTEAAYRNGAITGDIYAGVTATLTGKLLTLAKGAGIATGAIYALNSAQADMASPEGRAIGDSIANRIQSQQQTSGREQNRREMERYNRDLARSQERSAGRAGKLLEDGAKKANQELKSALDKVPGLFSASQVTEQDMKDAELGVYQEKADEYLRRLRDEVQNGNDWEDVSLEEARAGLERAGLEVGSTAEQTVALLEKAINDSSLYSAVENIPIFINEEAVKFTQELQSKSEQGRKNIYEYFGIQVDEAVGAATGGGGGGGVAVRPPELIDIDPHTEGLQTGLDEYVSATGEVIKEQLVKATRLFLNPDELFSPSTMGAATKPEITVTADATAQAWLPVVTGKTTTATVALGVAGPQAAPSMDGEKTKLLITDYYEVVTPEGGKVKLVAADFFAFDGSIPVETVNRADLVTFTNALPVEQVNRAKLVVFLSELPTEQIDRSALVAFVSEVSKEEIDRSGLVSFLSELPTEQVDRSTLIGYINSPATETIDRAKLVTAINELPIQEVNRQTLVSYLNALPSETVDRSTLVGFVNAIPAENVDRSALVSFANAVPTEQVDRSDLIAFVNALPAENIDRSALVSFLGSVPSEAVDRQTLVSYLNSVPTETIDRANVVAFLGNVPSEQVDRTALVAYTGTVPTFTVDLSQVVEFAGEAVKAAQDKLYSLLYGPSPEKPDTMPGITDAGPYAIDIQAQLSPAAYQSYLDYKAEVEANPPTIMPMLQAPGQRLGDVESLGTVDVTANIIKFDVTAQIDETALSSLTAPIVYAPQSDAQADFITPLVTGLTTQIGANQEQIGAQGASVAQIIIAGMIAAFQGTQQGGETTTAISDALFFAVNTQFTTAQSSFFTVGSIPAVAVESGFKGYAYDGLSSGLLDALTNGIRADADAYMQRGGTIAGYVQKGIGDGFSSDIGIRSAVTAGGVWGNAFVQGALNAINAAGFVDQITTAVVDGITEQVEQP